MDIYFKAEMKDHPPYPLQIVLTALLGLAFLAWVVASMQVAVGLHALAQARYKSLSLPQSSPC